MSSQIIRNQLNSLNEAKQPIKKDRKVKRKRSEVDETAESTTAVTEFKKSAETSKKQRHAQNLALLSSLGQSGPKTTAKKTSAALMNQVNERLKESADTKGRPTKRPKLSE